MCGIIGIISPRPRDQVVDAAERAMRAIAHRGPDDQGLEIIPASAGRTLVLGHTRLSILDLSSAGHQPMRDCSTGDWITYNGEVFNFREVRSTITGRSFTSESDTEVILAGLADRGTKAIDPWRGMFALAWWDLSVETLTLIRDRLGIKPLYYYQSGDELIFASEVRALLSTGLVPRKLSAAALESYLTFGSVEQPLTIIDNVFAVLPGHAVKFCKSQLSEEEYWRIDANARIAQSSVEEELVEEIRPLLEEAVKLRLVSDVPVGVFLSGGVDSSALVSLLTRASAAPIKTFTISFNEEDFSERDHAARVASRFGTEHHEILMTAGSVLEKLPRALSAMDQPSIDGINSWVVSEAVRNAGLKVAISGLGGDEVFAGYQFFRTADRDEARLRRAQHVPRPIRRIAARAVGLAVSGNRGTKIENLLESDDLNEPAVRLHRQLFSSRQRESLLGGRVASSNGDSRSNPVSAWMNSQMTRCAQADPINRTSALELGGYLANTLLRDTDSMSMAHALEVRVPFIDHVLVEKMLSIPGHLKIKQGRPKWLLVDAVRDLPSEIVDRPKKGFEFPFKEWLTGALRDEVTASLESSQMDSIFDKDAVRSVWNAFERGSISWSRVWSFYVMERWAQCNL